MVACDRLEAETHGPFRRRRDRVEQRSFEEVSGTWGSSSLDRLSKQVPGRETEKKEERMSPFAEVVLLASDGSGESDRAARMAVELSRNLGSELHVIQVAPLCRR